MLKTWKSNPRYGYVMLALLCLAIALPDYAQYQVTSLADRIRTELSLSQSQYSSVATAPLLVGIVLCFLSGLLVDRFGTKMLLISVGVSALGIILRVYAQGFWSLYLCMAAMGFAASFVNATTPKVMGAYFPPAKVTVMMGVVIAVANAGMALGTGTAAMFPTTRAAFSFSAVFAAVVLALWLLLNTDQRRPARGEEDADRAPFRDSLRAVLRSKQVWLCALCCFGLTIGVLGSTIYMPQALMSRGLTERQAGWMGMAVTLGNMATSFVTPTLIRRFGTTVKRVRTMLLCYMLPAMVLEALAWRAPMGPLLAIGLFVTGFLAMGFLAFIPAMPMYLDGIGRRYAGTATGLVLTVQLVGSVVFPSYIAAPIAGDNYTLLFCLLAATALIPSLLVRRVPFAAYIKAMQADGQS